MVNYFLSLGKLANRIGTQCVQVSTLVEAGIGTNYENQ